MQREQLLETRDWIREELALCIGFWLKNGMDAENGGIYTCLDREGKIYSTDKSVWMQGRCGWLFSWLCRVYGAREEWLAAAKSCLDFMEAHCINRKAGDRMYFTVTSDGKPLRQRRYFFSEAFYAMANAEYYGVTGDAVCLERARRAYELYWNLAHGMPDPTGLGAKTIPETRAGRAFGVPMICLNVSSILLRTDADSASLYAARAAECVDEIFRYHVHPELSCILENVGANGEARLDISEGRVVNPGHDLEFVWFLAEHAGRTGDASLIEKAERLFRWAADAGWDREYGGLLYLTDALHRPPEAYEHDMKLWWPHAEMMISSLMLWRRTGKEEYLDLFIHTLDYARERFSDREYGEWYGYLRRDGAPTQPACKGSTFKGPFHLPRMLVMADTMLTDALA